MLAAKTNSLVKAHIVLHNLTDSICTCILCLCDDGIMKHKQGGALLLMGAVLLIFIRVQLSGKYARKSF